MLLYCLIVWLIGIGLFIGIYNKEKEAGLFKPSDVWGYFWVWLVLPTVLPIIIGIAAADTYYEAKE